MDLSLLDGSFNPFNMFKVFGYRIKFAKDHPTYFKPEGLLVFCGSQR